MYYPVGYFTEEEDDEEEEKFIQIPKGRKAMFTTIAPTVQLTDSIVT